jgi:beta-lactamase regulating signal transducer with metallopeptidase domain
MITTLWWLGQNTITTAIMILFASAACRRFRYRPAVQHVLWVVVLLKFATPPIVCWPWSVERVEESIRSVVTFGAESVRSTFRHRPEQALDSGWLETDDRGAAAALFVPLESSSGGGAADGIRLLAVAAARPGIARISLGLVLGIWLVGAAIYVTKQLRRIAGHALLVQRAARAPGQLMYEVKAMAKQVGLQPPRVLVARGIISPFVWFVGRLRLVWPESMSSRDEVVRSRAVIAHELAHIRRGDHWVAWLELVAGLVWWWNPLFWLVRRRIRVSAEMACDAMALSVCPENRGAYAKLLLELSAGPRSGAPAPVLGVSASTPSSFERRLSMILSDRVGNKVSVSGFVMAGILALVALPGWSWAQQPPAREVVLQGVVDDLPLAEVVLHGGFPVAGSALETVAQSDETASAVGATAARLDKLEAEISRLSRLLEQRQPPSIALYYDRIASPNAAPQPVMIKGLGRTYVVSGAEKRAFLTALTNEGRQIWVSSFPAPMAIRGEGVTWTLDEPSDRNQVILTWAKANERVKFCFDTTTGRVLTEQKMGGDVALRTDQLVVSDLPVAVFEHARLPEVNDAYRQIPDNKMTVTAEGIGQPAGRKLPMEARAGGRANTSEARLKALEMAVEDLRKRLEVSASAAGSSMDPQSAYQQALAKLKDARYRVDALLPNRAEADRKKAELEAAKAALQEAQLRVEKLQKILQSGSPKPPPPR